LPGAPELGLRSCGRAASAASSLRLRQWPHKSSPQDTCRRALTRTKGLPASSLRSNNWVRFAKSSVPLYNLKLCTQPGARPISRFSSLAGRCSKAIRIQRCPPRRQSTSCALATQLTHLQRGDDDEQSWNHVAGRVVETFLPRSCNARALLPRSRTSGVQESQQLTTCWQCPPLAN